jgi:hypothetical protein
VTYPPPDPYGPPAQPGPWQPTGQPGEPPLGDPVYVPQPYPYPPQQEPYGYGYPQPGVPYPPYGGPYPRPPRQPMRIAAPQVGWSLIGTALVALIAALLPWAYVFGVGINGTDGNGDGNATLFFAIVVIAMGIVVAAGGGRVWTSIVACVFSALIVLVSLIDLSDIANVASNDGLGGVAVDVGPGLWISLLAGLAALTASIIGIARRAPRT